MKNAVYLLFPYPVMICAENYQSASSEKNKSDRVRTSISFNTYVRGVVGGRDKLTEVNFS